MHPTASVFINDAENGLLHDYDVWLEKLAPHAPTTQAFTLYEAGIIPRLLARCPENAAEPNRNPLVGWATSGIQIKPEQGKELVRQCTGIRAASHEGQELEGSLEVNRPRQTYH